MYNEKFYLTTQDILDKEFKIDARGYRPQEVDKFLDMIIRDYTEFMNIIKKLEKELTNIASMYQMELDKLKELMGDAEKDAIKKDTAVQKAVDFVVEAAKEV